MIVVDASVVVSWFFDDEVDDFAKKSAARTAKGSALVPPIFPAEVANALFFANRKNRISEADMRAALTRIADLPIRIDSLGFELHDEVRLASTYNLTIFDAMYLALARRRRIPLLTRDAALRRAAASEKVLSDEENA